MMLGFVGTDTTNPSEVRATNAANAKVGGQVESFGSASDIARLRLQDVDEAGLSTDFKTVNFTLTNNVAGEKVIAKLGPKYLTAGDIQVDIGGQMIFTNHDVTKSVRFNKTVGFGWVITHSEPRA